MFDFGDNLSVEPARIPWLIWIQLVVTFLLILFLYLLTFFTLDPSYPKTTHSSSSSSSSASPSTPPFLSPNSTPLPKPRTSMVDSSHITQVGEQGNVKGDISTSTCRRIVGGGEDMFERESPWPMHAYFHPCNYFRLARIVFLKCLGLESTSENLTSDRNKSQKHRERTRES